MTEKLKPCPFCGGAELGLRCDPSEGLDNSGPSRAIQCYGCGVEAPFYDTEAEAITAWNTRPQSDLTREGVRSAIRQILVETCRGEIHAATDAILAMVPGGGDLRCYECNTDLIGPICPACNPLVPGGVPDGWKLVPVEPTEAMLDKIAHEMSIGDRAVRTPNRVYRAMLSAAPLPSAPKEGDQ